MTSPKNEGHGTGVVFLGFFRTEAKSPESNTASAGRESIVIVF
jgi:hypothetical protein